MDPLAFLDKQSRHQVHIFQFLIKENREVEVEKLLSTFSFSTPTIQKAVGQLKEKLYAFHSQTDLYLLDKTLLKLSLPNDFDLRAFLYTTYYETSIDVILLDQLYTVRDLSITKLTLELQVSEASLFRRLKRVNDLLTDFDIGYKNKQLMGNAEDIQLFYYHFYTSIYPIALIQKRFYRESFSQLLKIIESTLGITFSKTQTIRVMLWLSLMEKQLDIRTGRKFSSPSKLLEQTTKSFKQLEQIFLRFSSRYAMQWPFEAIGWFYVFLQAEGFLFVEGESSQRLQQLTLEIQRLLAIPESNTVVMQQLYQIHFYVSYQKVIWKNEFTKAVRLSDTHPELFYAIMEKVEQLLPTTLPTVKWEYLDYEYARILDFLQHTRKQVIILYCHLDISEVFLREETKQILEIYSQQLDIELRYSEDIKEFTITTNNPLEQKKDSVYFYLETTRWTTYSLAQLYQIFVTIKKEKEVRE